MFETIFASGEAITKAVSYFSGLEVTGLSWTKGRKELSIGGGFYLLAESHELGKEYRKQQSEYGYSAKRGTLLLYKYKAETIIAIYDDPFQEFIKVAAGICIATTCKVYPFSFAVINDTKKPVNFYRPRNYLSCDDYNTQAGEKRAQIALKDLSGVTKLVPKITTALKDTNNTKIKDALTYYQEYLRETDPKFELVLLGMILEVLFIEDGSTSELQTKLMVRVARFLFPRYASSAERQTICQFIKEIYQIRSHVLHGSEYQKVLQKGAKKHAISPQQYLTTHIANLEKLVGEVLGKILASKCFLELMSRYPRRADDPKILEFYSRLVIG